MSEENLLSTLAELLRPNGRNIFIGKEKLCLSTSYLQSINEFFDENIEEELTSSFHSTGPKTTLQLDAHFLLNLIAGASSLKLTSDLEKNDIESVVNLKRFSNIRNLQIEKVDVMKIIGIQRLRPQIRELTYCHGIKHLADILEKCGGDMSQGNLWSALKEVNLHHNFITELDQCFESTPWLVSLDLSHNVLTSVDFINCLPQLKYLNISFNKLDKVPRFRGQISKTLQVLNLNNNFIEDISNTLTVSNIFHLDLSQNSIIHHNSLQSISHLPSLHLLNLQGNPICFHPHHRMLCCQYLNKDTAALNFILNNIPLNKSEKQLAGLFRPIAPPSTSLESSNNSSVNSLETSSADKVRKVRDVVIADENNVVVEVKRLSSTPKINTSHLEMKKQIEQLRQEHGDSWLHKQSGEIFKDVLGFSGRSETVASSTPYEDSTLLSEGAQTSSTTEQLTQLDVSPVSTQLSDTTNKDQQAGTSKQKDKEDVWNFDSNGESAEEILSDDEDVSNGELFYGTSNPDCADYDLVILVGETSLSERETASIKETARWSINAIESCERGAAENQVNIIFDTVRKNRKSRTYYIEEADKFVESLQRKKAKIPEIKITYECIKCTLKFTRSKIKQNQGAEINCPNCNSVHIVECQ